MQLEYFLEPENLPVTKFEMSYPASGERPTGTITIAGDGEALASQTDIYLTISVTTDGQTFSRKRGPFKGVGTFVHDPQAGETKIPIVVQGTNLYSLQFVPLAGKTVSENLDRNWPGLKGKERIPPWLLAAVVDIPIESALNFSEPRGFFNYLLGPFGYYLIEEAETGTWALGGGATADAPVQDLPVDENPRNRDTLTPPGKITVRGKEEKSATPPPETPEQAERRQRVARILAEAKDKGRITKEEEFELSTDGEFTHETGERDEFAEAVGYMYQKEHKVKQNRLLTVDENEQIQVQEAPLTDADGNSQKIVSRHRTFSRTDNHYGMLGTVRVSTGSDSVAETEQALINPPVMDPPLTGDTYGTRTTTKTRKFWTPGGWVRQKSITTTTEQLKNGNPIYSEPQTDVTTWTRVGKYTWHTMRIVTTWEQVPVFTAEGDIAYYRPVPHTKTYPDLNAPPPEMAPQTDDGLRNLAGDSGGAAQYTVTPEGIAITGMHGSDAVLDFPYLVGQANVDLATGLALQLLGAAKGTRQRTYYAPTNQDRGDGGGAVRSITITADAEEEKEPYKEVIDTEWIG